ncbi:MAG: aminotransferase class V-fold PLP-dependent enzyme, partial [Candidatus Omnitrophota bacterium]
MIYLNNAATSFPKPEETIEAVTTYLGSAPFHCLRSGYIGQEEDVIVSSRGKLAALFNAASPDNIVFTSGGTESLNLVIRGLDLSGGHVITTAIEHNSVLRPLKRLEKERSIELSIVGCDRDGHVEAQDVAESIRKNTKALIINHCSNVTGRLIDLNAMREVCSSGKILFIVDASQSAGCVPIDVEKGKIDILIFTGHKSLYGIPGIGGLYIKEGISLAPLKVGGTGIKSEDEYQPDQMPLRYEAGTPNVPGIVSLGAGVDFILKTGIERIMERKRRHVIKMIEELGAIPGIELYGGSDLAGRVPIFCFNIPPASPVEVGELLESSFGVITRSGLHCAPLIHKALGTYPEGAVRVSPSYFTTDEEVAKFIYAVKQICEAK